jgi:hypothetical protein
LDEGWVTTEGFGEREVVKAGLQEWASRREKGEKEKFEE